MADSTLTTVAPAWALGAAVLLGLLALFAAVVDGVLAAKASGRSGIAALPEPAYEVARLMRQRRRTTVAADTLLWRIGGAGLIVAALLKVTVIPLGSWTLFDFEAGIVWFNALDVTIWAFVWLAGWGANSVHSLIGGYRFLALAIAYELPLMFALIAPAIAAESLNLGTVAAAQSELWFVVWMPVAFLVYCLSVVAFSVWGPFSSAVGSDVAGGVAVELSGVDRLLFFAGRYAVLAAGAAFAVPMFLGGGSGPLLPAWAWVLLKAAVLLAAFVWLRRKVPLLRPDRFLELGWVVLIPLVLAQDLVVALIVIGGIAP